MPALGRFLIIFTATLAAAATIGKLVPHIPRLAAQFDISLAAAGFLVSSVMLPGALAGPLFGALVDRVSPQRIALFGLALEAAASATLPWAPSAGVFFAIRLVEGAGFTFVAVAATLIVVEVSSLANRALALGTFSAFAPLGFALGQLLAAGMSDRSTAFGHSVVLVAMLALVAVGMPASKPASVARSSMLQVLRFAPALRTGMAFGCVAGLLLGAVALAPLVIGPAHGLSVQEAARLTALAAMPGIAGRFMSGWLLGRSAPLRMFAIAAGIGVLFVPAALVAPVPLAVALACFCVFQICMGALAGMLSAMLPRVAPSPSQLGTVTGLANQMITAGNLLGPPAVLAVFAAAGTTSAAVLLAVALAFGVWLVSGVPAYRGASAS
ncbi:MAG TPA: MFS transporter [Burkholderiales bacterium]|nr:MFS transporter [Burkholderiales bacterium]